MNLHSLCLEFILDYFNFLTESELPASFQNFANFHNLLCFVLYINFMFNIPKIYDFEDRFSKNIISYKGNILQAISNLQIFKV